MRYANSVKRTSAGSALIGALILTAIAALVLSGLLSVVSTGVRTEAVISDRGAEYYDVEAEFRRAAGWLREHSQDLLAHFRRTQFYSSFDLSAPSTGANDTSIFSVPTRVKMQGGGDSPILTNDALLADAAYPGGAFDAQAEFAANFAGAQALLRITLVDAIPVSEAGDFGDPDSGNPAPSTDFFPVFRVDSMVDLFQGPHVYGFMIGEIESGGGKSFYGSTNIRIRQSCDAYDSSKGPYNQNGNRSADCWVTGDGDVRVHTQDTVYGGLSSNGTVYAKGNWKGMVCATFEKDCPKPGPICAGAGCGVPTLEPLPDWKELCPKSQGDLTVKTDQVLIISGSDPKQRCWDTVTVKKNKTLILSETEFGYYIQKLTLKSGAKVSIVPEDAAGTVELVVSSLSSRTLNGARWINTTQAPPRFSLRYLNSATLTINGSADFYARISAPAARVNFGGSFDFYGAVEANDFRPNGTGWLHADMASGGQAKQVTDMGFKLRGFGEYFR